MAARSAWWLLALAVIPCGRPLAATGIYGAPYQVIEVAGVSAWEQYRKVHVNTSTAATYPPVVAQALGTNPLVFENLRQGCGDGGECAFLAPGLFLGRRTAKASPAWAAPVLVGTSALRLDMRVGFVEAGPGGDLSDFVAAMGGDLGHSDLYFGGFPNDFLSIHFWVDGTGSMRTVDLAHVTCATAGSALFENERTEYRAAVSVAVPEAQPLRWEIAEAASKVEFVLSSGATEIHRWTLSGGGAPDRLHECANPDGGQYSEGRLDLDRLVPVFFVGWASDSPPTETTMLTLGFSGFSPSIEQAPAEVMAGEAFEVQVAVRDLSGARLTSGDLGVVLTASGAGEQSATPTQAAEGLQALTVRFLEPGRQTLRLALASDPQMFVERAVQVAHAEVGMVVGCQCQQAGTAPLAFLLVSLLAWRRRGTKPRGG